MRDEFFGDLNDYFKYALLRLLTRKGEFSTGVCWMLRADERATGGYLNKDGDWRTYDPELFDALRKVVRPASNPRQAERSDFPLGAGFLFFHEYLSDEEEERTRYFDRALKTFKDVNLIFFDPDNGLEIRTVPPGRRHSSKYLYWDEVSRAYTAGKSLLIYQHLPRVPRERFIAEKQKETRSRIQPAEVFVFQTPKVAFFLAVQPCHREYFRKRVEEIRESAWCGEGQIVVYQSKPDRR
jgi:hypothetical protein